MDDLDKMARSLLADQYDCDLPGSRIAKTLQGEFEGQLRVADVLALAAIRAALMTAPPGCALVPEELIDAFPEINPSNYDHDQACRLNAWGCEVVTCAAPEPEA